jgi:peptide deformylase
MLKYKGMGLAAPQIGVPLHLLATQLYPDQAADQPRFGKPDVLIYLTLSDSSANYKEAEEGCLSISALYVDRMAKRQKRCSSLPSMHRSNTSN